MTVKKLLEQRLEYFALHKHNLYNVPSNNGEISMHTTDTGQADAVWQHQ